MLLHNIFSLIITTVHILKMAVYAKVKQMVWALSRTPKLTVCVNVSCTSSFTIDSISLSIHSIHKVLTSWFTGGEAECGRSTEKHLVLQCCLGQVVSHAIYADLKTSVYQSFWGICEHRAEARDGIPLDVRDEPPGPRPASHNIGLLIRSTASTFRNNTMQTEFNDTRKNPGML